MTGGGKGRRDSGPQALLGRLLGILRSLPLLRKLFPPPASPEPFASIEDVASKLDALAEPNAAPQLEGGRKKKPPRLDPSAILAGLLQHPLRLALISALVLVILLSAISSLIASAPPRPPAPAPSPTKQGESLAGKLLLPPDPILDLRPELESEPKAVYTEEDLSRLRPLVEEGLRHIEVSALSEANDREAEALFQAVP